MTGPQVLPPKVRQGRRHAALRAVLCGACGAPMVPSHLAGPGQVHCWNGRCAQSAVPFHDPTRTGAA